MKKAAGIYVTVILLLASSNLAVADGIDLSGDALWTYRTSESSNVPSTSDFSQNYSLEMGITKNFTSTLALSGTVTWAKVVQEDVSYQEVYPSFYLNFSPPSLYYLSFNYNRSEIAPPGSDPLSSSSSSASFSLPLEKWPSLALSYDRYTVNDYNSPRKVDQVSEAVNVGSSYGLNFLDTHFSISYSYNIPTSEDNVDGQISESQIQRINTGISRTFFDNKLSMNAGYGINIDKGTATSKEDSFFPEEISESGVGIYHANQITEGGPHTVDMTQSQTLTDADTSNAAVDSNNREIDLDAAYRNIGINYQTAQSLNGLNLYINTENDNINLYIEQWEINFGWELYTSSNGLNWTRIIDPFESVSYDALNSRIEFPFSERIPAISTRYIKIVNSTFPIGALTSPIKVTEIRGLANRLAVASTELESNKKSQFASLSLSFGYNDRFNATYNAGFNTDTEDDNDNESTGVSHTISMKSILFRNYLDLTTSYGISDSTSSNRINDTQEVESSDDGSRVYSLSISSSPLPSINTSLSYSNTESSIDGEVTSKADSIGFTLYMNLYTGVSMGAFNQLSNSEDVTGGSEATANTRGLSLSITPWNFLASGINWSSTESKSTGVDESTQKSTALDANITFTPTRRIFGTYAMTFEPVSSQSMSLSWLMPTNKIQTSMALSFSGNSRSTAINVTFLPISNFNIRFSISDSKSGNEEVRSTFVAANLSFK